MRKKLGLIIGDGWISAIEIKKILDFYLSDDIKFEIQNWRHKSLKNLQNDNLRIEKGYIENIKLQKNIYKNINKYAIIVVHFAPLKKIVFNNNKNLKLIASLRSGIENINPMLAKKNKIKIVNNPGRNANAVKEYTIAMMLNLIRQINVFSLKMNKKIWPNITSQKYGHPTFIGELKSSKIGIIGFGLIGKSVAKILKNFGSEILIYEPDKNKHIKYFTFVNLNYLLRNSDIVSFHAKSKNVILGKKNFNLLKKNCFIINSSRSNLIDEKMLLDSLRKKKIAGAAIDVFEKEPIPKNHPLFKLDNVILTPHIAGASDQMLSDCIHIVGKKIQKKMVHLKNKNS